MMTFTSRKFKQSFRLIVLVIKTIVVWPSNNTQAQSFDTSKYESAATIIDSTSTAPTNKISKQDKKENLYAFGTIILLSAIIVLLFNTRSRN